MEENKVASNSDLRERAFKTYRKLREIALNPAGVHVDSVDAIFRELVAVRDEAKLASVSAMLQCGGRSK